jgi:ribonuclease HI
MSHPTCVERLLAVNEITDLQESLEWRSVLDAVLHVDARKSLPTLDQSGIVAYTDGACIKNPGGPAGWSALLWAATDVLDGAIRQDAPSLECYGHIPKAPTTTNNRAEIAAVLAVLSIAPPTLPLTINSDSEYTINVAQGKYQMKANPDLWAVYRKLLGFRKQSPTFNWVRGHAGQLHNERADELAGLGAWHGDLDAYAKWQSSQTPEARNSPPPAQLATMRQQALKLKALFDTISPDNPRVSSQERKFVDDMTKRLQKNNFSPSDKQSGWLKGLVAKYKV